MPRFDEDRAALFAKGLVQAHMWTSDPRASGKDSVFIFKNAIHNKNFFTAILPMWVELGLRGHAA